MTHVLSMMEPTGASFSPISENAAEFKPHELFVSGNFHITFLEHGYSEVN